MIRTVAERGIVADAVQRPEEWIEQRLAQHRNPGGPLLHPQSNGRWIQVSERKTQDGGTVGLFTDVTELKRREEALAEAIDTKDQSLRIAGRTRHDRVRHPVHGRTLCGCGWRTGRSAGSGTFLRK